MTGYCRDYFSNQQSSVHVVVLDVATLLYECYDLHNILGHGYQLVAPTYKQSRVMNCMNFKYLCEFVVEDSLRGKVGNYNLQSRVIVVH